MGRPRGSKNKPKASPPQDVLEPVGLRPGFEVSTETEPTQNQSTRATLEADRDRLLQGIEECKRFTVYDDGERKEWTDWKTVAALQAQLNGVNRMLLKITGETAPTDANLIRSPQYLRLKTDLLDTLKRHPAALADVVKIFDTAER